MIGQVLLDQCGSLAKALTAGMMRMARLSEALAAHALGQRQLNSLTPTSRCLKADHDDPGASTAGRLAHVVPGHTAAATAP